MPAAAIYARYSSDQQRDASIEDQVRLCRERADREGWPVHASYADHGVSGASLMRPGIQQLLQDAAAGRFEIVLAEALDRLSRDQEDIAAIYKRLRFAGVLIVTLSEGEIGNLHIGLKGTMNAIFLQDLADKTRRGLRGRIEAGKSGGGLSYGYDVVRQLGADGMPVRGERRINPEQAAVVGRIFRDYAAGVSPRAIAIRLNAEGVPAPADRAWGPSTIHGNRQRGTGILNNELYVGRLVWNRLRYVKDPATGKRVSRLNDASAWIVQDVPALRIVEQELWDRAKARQGTLEASGQARGAPGYWTRKRPQYLFSGLMSCGVCGGGAVVWSRVYVGCASARNKGTCSNRHTIRRDELEAAVLDGLQHRLMDPALTEVFCQEYTAHLNRLRIREAAEQGAFKAELARVTRELDRLVQAIMDGVPGSHLRDKMAELELRKENLASKLQERTTSPPLLHPAMAARYRAQVLSLRAALTDRDRSVEAAEIIRGLIDRIALVPVIRGERRTLEINLHGALAGILALATKATTPLERSGVVDTCTKLVAGAGFEPATFRL